METSYKPLVLSELNPPMNITYVVDSAGIMKLKDFFERMSKEPLPYFGFDTETNWTVDFWNRRVRTMQFGNKTEQYVVDLLKIAGTPEVLDKTQGYYSINNGNVYKELLDVITEPLCSDKFLKVGQNLSFEYEVMNWNFGLRIWNMFSTDLAERVIQAGRIPLKKYSEFSMVSIFQRYFGLTIDKTEQSQFTLDQPLTDSQINYAAFDSRAPISMWQVQSRILEHDKLARTATIENDAIGSFVDMHLQGQNLDDEKWIERIGSTGARRIEDLKVLDEAFIPIVGLKDKQIDDDEIYRLELVWKTHFEEATQEEKDLAAKIRLEKDKEKKTVLREELKELDRQRKAKKAEARKAFSEKSKERTEWRKEVPKMEGNAYINYSSSSQLLEALRKLLNTKNIFDTSDDTLLDYNDIPVIQVLRRYKKGKKSTSTYGEAWVTRWTTKPSKEEGWRHPGDGRLHCKFNQLEAETGRTSSSSPNGQNLPREKSVRDCFIADPPHPVHGEMCLVTVDMSGAELRIIADLANATSWINAFNKGWDVHSVSTEILEKKKWEEGTEAGCKYYEKDANGEPRRQKCSCMVHKKLRENTKAINFLLCYGGGPDALADELGITVDAAKELMREHRAAFPDVWNFLEASGEQAKRDKESRDMYGRRRLFIPPDRKAAIQWWYDDEDRLEKLELPINVAEANIQSFKMENLREPSKEEVLKLTHRPPSEKEVNKAYYAILNSIARKGKNHRIQGTNVSIIKRAMGAGKDVNGVPYLWHTLPQYHARLQSMVHDELIISCPLIYGEKVKALVGDAFRRAAAEVMTKIEMEHDGHVADRWVKD